MSIFSEYRIYRKQWRRERAGWNDIGETWVECLADFIKFRQAEKRREAAQLSKFSGIDKVRHFEPIKPPVEVSGKSLDKLHNLKFWRDCVTEEIGVRCTGCGRNWTENQVLYDLKDYLLSRAQGVCKPAPKR